MLKNYFRNLFLNIKINRKLLLCFFILISIVFFVVSSPVFAQTTEDINQQSSYVTDILKGTSNALGSAIALVLGFIALIITSVFGLITTLLVKILVDVAQFNNIIDVEAVKIGWVTVRDICNMFFVLVLLVISFSTILRIENYSAKRLLPKLLIMAILINFSRTIFGLIIDFSQVIMLTFTSAFQEGGGWFIEMFNVKDLFTATKAQKALSSDSALDAWATVVAIIAGVIASLVTMIVVLILLIVFAVRIVMLWIYTILSPLIFLGFAFPPLQKYTNRIWEDFIKQVMIGPILAFFIWLALTVVDESVKKLATATGSHKSTLVLGDGSSAFFGNAELQTYIITIGFLAGGLMVAQQFGGAAGSMAGKGIGWIKKGGMAPIVLGKKGVKGAAGVGATYLSQGGDDTRRAGFRNFLGRVGGSESKLASLTGARKLATSTLTGMDKRKQAVKDDAQKYVSNIGDTRILQRMAGQSGATPWQAAIRDAARNKMPTGLLRTDNNGSFTNESIRSLQGHLSNMSVEDFSKLSKREISAIGESGASLPDELRESLEGNRASRKAYNEGVYIAEGNNWVRGRNRDGTQNNDLGFNLNEFNYDNVANNNIPIIDDLRYVRGVRGTGENRYKTGGREKITNKMRKVKEKYANFGKGFSNMIVTDLEELRKDAELAAFVPDPKKKSRGVSLKNRQDINKVSQALSKRIEKQIEDTEKEMARLVKSADYKIYQKPEALKSKNILENKMNNLISAHTRLSQPDKLKSLQLVHTERRRGDVAHEMIHGAGAYDESVTEQLEKRVLKGEKITDKDGNKELLFNKIRKAAIGRGRTPEEIIKLEREKDVKY